jgi:glycosyltransferase involved in cell wall biosynthesis
LNKPKIILRSPNSPKLIFENKELNFIIKKLLNIVYNSADKIIAQTPEMKDEIIAYHNVDSSKIEVFLNPIDNELIEQKILNIENPFDSKKINIVAAGRLLKQKGFDILIESLNIIINNKNNIDFKLSIIGEDVVNEKKNLEKLISIYNIEKYVEFLGFQDNPYKFFYYSDLYVLSSRWEGLPNTVLENLYLKKPIIATRCIPFMDSLIIDGENGFLVDVENKEQLANAIINYKKIKPINFNKKKLNIDSIFELGVKNEFK